MTEVANVAAYDRSELMTNTSEIVSAFIGRNNMTPEQVPGFITSVMGALHATPTASTGTVEGTGTVEKLSASAVKKSITPDYLTSFIDGKQYKSLKRHLATRGHDPVSYRAAYGLPDDYPMVAASYSAARSALAATMGLGQQRRKDASAPAPDKAPKEKPKKKTPGTN